MKPLLFALLSALAMSVFAQVPEQVDSDPDSEFAEQLYPIQTQWQHMIDRVNRLETLVNEISVRRDLNDLPPRVTATENDEQQHMLLNRATENLEKAFSVATLKVSAELKSIQDVLKDHAAVNAKYTGGIIATVFLIGTFGVFALNRWMLKSYRRRDAH